MPRRARRDHDSPRAVTAPAAGDGRGCEAHAMGPPWRPDREKPKERLLILPIPNGANPARDAGQLAGAQPSRNPGDDTRTRDRAHVSKRPHSGTGAKADPQAAHDPFIGPEVQFAERSACSVTRRGSAFAATCRCARLLGTPRSRSKQTPKRKAQWRRRRACSRPAPRERGGSTPATVTGSARPASSVTIRGPMPGKHDFLGRTQAPILLPRQRWALRVAHRCAAGTRARHDRPQSGRSPTGMGRVFDSSPQSTGRPGQGTLGKRTRAKEPGPTSFVVNEPVMVADGRRGSDRPDHARVGFAALGWRPSQWSMPGNMGQTMERTMMLRSAILSSLVGLAVVLAGCEASSAPPTPARDGGGGGRTDAGASTDGAARD